MSYEFSHVLEDLMGTGILSALVSGVPSSLLGLASYILTALALYTVAQRRGLNRPWLAWIPVVNCWIIGSLSDQYRYVVKGEIKSRRKVLLVLNILMAVLSIAVICIAVFMVITVAGGAIRGVSEEQIVESALGSVVGVLGLALPMAGVAIAFAVIRYMSLYDIYRSMDPVNCVLYTVLSILVGVTEPFFLFFNRNKDLGMPPRRQEPVNQDPVYTTWEEPAAEEEPQMNFWENAPEDKDYL